MRAPLALAAILLTSPALARPLTSDAPDCGGAAHSSASVVEHRPRQRGPITAVPQTLCADLTPQQGPTRVEIFVNPYLSPEGGAENGASGAQNGTGRGSAPYRGRPVRQ